MQCLLEINTVWCCSNMMWMHLAAERIGPLHNTDSIMTNIWQLLSTSARKLKLHHKWAFWMDNDSGHTSRDVAMSFLEMRFKYLAKGSFNFKCTFKQMAINKIKSVSILMC